MGNDDRQYEAIVQEVFPMGKHGPYAVASTQELGSVTFSLNQPVWQESDWPDPGMYVVLWKVRKKRAGWRAIRGRHYQPSDNQQPAKSKES